MLLYLDNVIIVLRLAMTQNPAPDVGNSWYLTMARVVLMAAKALKPTKFDEYVMGALSRDYPEMMQRRSKTQARTGNSTQSKLYAWILNFN